MHRTPLAFTQVTVNDRFWKPRMDTNRMSTIPAEYQQCKDTGRIERLKCNWKEGEPNKPHQFWDSDAAKWIEAASYSLAAQYDKDLDTLIDTVIASIAKSQAPDGYFNSYYQTIKPEDRWTDLREMHELYCAGHLMEAAVAHYQATGKRSLLSVMCRYADHIASVFGTKPGQKRGYCGHEEIELALVKLYRATGERNYLALAKYFIDERGQKPNYFEQEATARGEDPAKRRRAHETEPYSYYQAHRPVREQDRVTGHSVRAMYLYSAMADIAAEYGDKALLAACEKLWDHLTTKNMYITGGIGSSRANEGFTFDYDLPNETAYAETCANIGLSFWAHRMFHLTGDGKYIDTMERALYNSVISGVSLDGTRFFYDNKLSVLAENAGLRHDGMTRRNDHHRSEWFGCSCCPPNIARLLASFGGYIYSSADDGIFVNLYVQSSGSFPNGVTIEQRTHYPWDGAIELTLGMEAPRPLSLKLRIPGWCRAFTLSVNGKKVPAKKPVKGYITIARVWKNGDTVTLSLAMPVERIYANPLIRQNLGMTALMRGPVVYCIEGADTMAPVQNIALPDTAALRAVYKPKLLGGVTVIQGSAVFIDPADWGKTLYRTAAPRLKKTAFTAIPYCVWDNRKKGGMTVWMPRA